MQGDEGRNQIRRVEGQGWTHLMARYMGRMAKSGKVCTLIMMVINAMYSRTLMKPAGIDSWLEALAGSVALVWVREAQSPLTCEQLCVEHVYGLIIPRVLALEVHRVQHVLDEDGEHHSHQDGILEGKGREGYVNASSLLLCPHCCTQASTSQSTAVLAQA
jgi:hypothetical protein